MKKITNKDTQKLENLYNLNKITELEKETKKLLKIEKNNLIQVQQKEKCLLWLQKHLSD